MMFAGKHRVIFAGLLWVLQAVVFQLHGQGLGDTLKIEEINVFSHRPVEQTALTVTQIDSAILSHHVSQSLSELIAEDSPLFIKSFGRGALATVSFRGTAPSHTKVTWNGLELNSPMLGMVDFSEVPVFFIDEIRLVHGNSSLTEMPGALGGIIDLGTKTRWDEGVSGSVMQGAGSFGTWNEFGRINAGSSRFQSSTRLFYNHSDNDFKYRNFDTPDSVNLQTGEKYYPVSVNKNAGYTNKGVLQQFALRRSEREVLDVNIWLQQSDRSLPMLSTDESSNVEMTEDNKPNGGINTNRQNDRFFRTAVNYMNYGDKGKFTLFSGMNVNLISYRMDRLVNGNGRITQLDSESKVLSIDNRATYRRSLSRRDEIKVDLRFVFDAVKTQEKITVNQYDKSRGETSLSLSWFHSLNKKLRLRSSAVAQLMGNTLVQPSVSIGGEYHFLPDDRLYIKASLSSNHRFPTLNDLYFQPGGNPSLRPENSISQEAGMVYRLAGKRTELSFGISAYHSNVRDWIIWLPSYKGNWEPFNIEKVTTDGVECNAAFSLKSGGINWVINGNYALTRSRNFGDVKNWADQTHGKQLPYIPLHSANLNISSEWHFWSVNYSWNYYSERFTTTSNLKASYRDNLYPFFMNQVRVGRSIEVNAFNLDLSLSVYNLFNETYRSVLQRQMPGRNFHVMARLSW